MMRYYMSFGDGMTLTASPNWMGVPGFYHEQILIKTAMHSLVLPNLI